jgi:hypothetical protein
MPAKPKAPRYQPGVIYDVTLTRPVRVGGLRLLPRNAHEIEGDALNALAKAEGEDVISAAAPRE